MSLVCAIHQPNFFPWLGYFDKIRRADVFVFLDDVDYPKSGNSMSSWVNRVRIAVNGEPVWLRVPVVRESGPQVIRGVRIDDSTPWRYKLLRTLEINYRRAARFAACMPQIEALMRHRCEFLADFNIHAISGLAALFGLRCELLRASALNVEGRATERLVNITQALGARAYLSGDGAERYQHDDMFARSGIQLQRLNFIPQSYIVSGAFLPGLSAIDFLMHREPESFHALVSKNDRTEH